MTISPDHIKAVSDSLAAEHGMTVNETLATQIAQRIGEVKLRDAIGCGLVGWFSGEALGEIKQEIAKKPEPQTLDQRIRQQVATWGFDLSKTYGEKKLAIYEKARAAIAKQDAPTELDRVKRELAVKEHLGPEDAMRYADAVTTQRTGNRPVVGARPVSASELPKGVTLSPEQKLAYANTLSNADAQKLVRSIAAMDAKIATMKATRDRDIAAEYVGTLRRQAKQRFGIEA